MVTFYKLFAVAVLGSYATAGLTGWEFGTAERKEIPASVRSSPGGHRSSHFWFSGIHGGK